MAEDNKVLEEIGREIRSIGDNQKTMKDSIQKDLEAVRKLAEEAKNKADNPEVKSQIDALKTSVLEKMDALTKTSTERMDEIEQKLNRRGLGQAGAKDSDLEFKQAAEFTRTMMSIKGTLNVETEFDEKSVDIEGYRAWQKNFKNYLRWKDERRVDVKAMQVGSDPNGGQVVPTHVSDRIIGFVYETSPLRQLATVETIGTADYEIPNDVGEFDAGWVGETQSRPETTTSQVGSQKIVVHEMYAQPKATQKFLEDAAINVENWFSRKVGDKFSRMEATAFISGDGVMKPRGILSLDAGSGSIKKIEQVNSGHASTVTADGVINTYISLKDFYAGNAVWLMRRATVGAVMLLKDGNSQYIWRPGLDSGKPSTLMGHAVYQAADMPAVAADALPIAFGNFREGYTIVDRLGITVLRDPFTAKPFVMFYSRKRVGGDVTNGEAIKLMKIAA